MFANITQVVYQRECRGGYAAHAWDSSLPHPLALTYNTTLLHVRILRVGYPALERRNTESAAPSGLTRGAGLRVKGQALTISG